MRSLVSAYLVYALLCSIVVFSTTVRLNAGTDPGVGSQQQVSASAFDSEKAASELNHHIAGLFLIVIGAGLIASERYPKARWLRWAPPLLFAMMGLFLLAWSDVEIWPRGNLGWTWLLAHDPEARQHKLYGLLLLAIGGVQAMQLIPRTNRRSLRAAFVILCSLGCVSLVFHHHSHADVTTAGPAGVRPAIPSHRLMAANAPVHHHDNDAMAMETMTSGSEASDEAGPHHHEHSASAEKIKSQHTWFAIIGFWVILFKLMYDYTWPATGLPRYLWPNSLMLLGFLLLLYTE